MEGEKTIPSYELQPDETNESGWSELSNSSQSFPEQIIRSELTLSGSYRWLTCTTAGAV